jgi:hypothetical protein
MSVSNTDTENRSVAEPAPLDDEAQAFYATYKDWVDMANELVERCGVFGDEHRVW